MRWEWFHFKEKTNITMVVSMLAEMVPDPPKMTSPTPPTEFSILPLTVPSTKGQAEDHRGLLNIPPTQRHQKLKQLSFSSTPATPCLRPKRGTKQKELKQELRFCSILPISTESRFPSQPNRGEEKELVPLKTSEREITALFL